MEVLCCVKQSKIQDKFAIYVPQYLCYIIFSHKVVNLNLIRDNGKDLDQERAFMKDASVVY